MLKRFLVVALAIVMCVSLIACGDSDFEGETSGNSSKISKEEGDFGKDSREINKLIANYFESYEECDLDTLEELCGPKNSDSISHYRNRISSYENSELYADKENLVFYHVMGIFIPATSLMAMDYIKLMGDMDALADYYEKINDGKLAIKYEIENVKNRDEADTLYYRTGLKWESAGIEDELDKYVDGEVEDWYSIIFKLAYTFNGDPYGYDENKTGEELYDILGENSNEIVKNIETNIRVKEDCIYTLLVYKVDGEWYAYRPDIFMASYMGVNYCPDDEFLEIVNSKKVTIETEVEED